MSDIRPQVMQLPPADVPAIDLKTGCFTPAWWNFFNGGWQRLGAYQDNVYRAFFQSDLQDADISQIGEDAATALRGVADLAAKGEGAAAELQEAEARLLLEVAIARAQALAVAAEDVLSEVQGLRQEAAILRGIVEGLRGEDAGTAVANLAKVAASGAYADLSGKPATQTGWTADAGTADRGAHATYSGTASVLYDQTELQGAMDALKFVTREVKALKDDLAAYGAIGP